MLRAVQDLLSRKQHSKPNSTPGDEDPWGSCCRRCRLYAGGLTGVSYLRRREQLPGEQWCQFPPCRLGQFLARLGLRSSGLHILLGGAGGGFQPKRRLCNATPEVRAVQMLGDVGRVLCVRKGRKQVLLGTPAWESLGCFESTQRFSADCTWEEWFCYKGRREPRMCPLFRPDKRRGQVLEASLMPSVTSSS